MGEFTRDGMVFDVDEWGAADGVPVVCLHGFPQDRQAFAEVATALAGKGCRILAPDQRGYSSRARPPGRRAYVGSELVADVLALLDAYGLQEAHVVGHDWGTIVGWLLAGLHPDRVTTLTALSVPHPAGVRDAVAVSTQALRSAYIGFFQLPVLPESALLAAEAVPLRMLLRRSGLPADIAARYTRRMREPGALSAALNWYRALPLQPPRPGRVRVPSLSVRGAREPSVVKQASVLASRYVAAPYRHVELPGAGHWLPETRADAIARLVLEHVDTYRGRT